ncbi:MAG: hypothetical protein ACREIT_09315, partial [Tepidisphaeraceae bacterium]
MTMAASPAAPVAVIDVLNALLEAELNSVFRFMDEGSPYLGPATAEVRRPLQEMVDTNQRHAADLYALIETLGGVPVPRSLQPEEQYLAYLSVKFLLPKLAEAKQLTIQRHENALRALPSAPPEVKGLLNAHLAEHRAQLDILH